MKEELTEDMHSEFSVENDTDIKHRVWSLLSEADRRRVKPDELKEVYNLTTEQIARYKESYLRLNK